MTSIVIISILDECGSAAIRSVMTVHTYLATYEGLILDETMARYWPLRCGLSSSIIWPTPSVLSLWYEDCLRDCRNMNTISSTNRSRMEPDGIKAFNDFLLHTWDSRRESLHVSMHPNPSNYCTLPILPQTWYLFTKRVSDKRHQSSLNWGISTFLAHNVSKLIVRTTSNRLARHHWVLKNPALRLDTEGNSTHKR